MGWEGAAYAALRWAGQGAVECSGRRWRGCRCSRCQAACPSAYPPAARLQGDCLDGAAELIVKQYKEVKRSDIYYIESKKKERYFEDAADDA